MIRYQEDGKQIEKKVGVSLSGGGFRAAVYHLGALKKLKEMGVLEKVDVISTVSGGSIIGACYGLYGNDFERFENVVKEGVKKDIINHIIRSARFIILVSSILVILAVAAYFLATLHDWITIIILFTLFSFIFRYQFKLLPVSKMIAHFYDKYFFRGATIKDLNPSPWIAMNATNLETGKPFTFSQVKMEDSSYEYPSDGGAPIKFNHEIYPLSKAVAASAGVPFAFTPIHIHPKYFLNPKDVDRVTPILVDGGVYDNQGIHKITQTKSAYHCDVIITSDAENLFRARNVYHNLIQVLVRTSEIFMNRIKNFQMVMNVFENYRFDKREVAYQVMGWTIEGCINMFIDTLFDGEVMEHVCKCHGITDDDIKSQDRDLVKKKIENSIGYDKILIAAPTANELNIAHTVPINIKALKDDQIHALMKQAACLTEVQVRLYCPSLFR